MDQGKKILVTGAGGFIGSHLVEALVEHGYSVKAFVRYNSRNNWGWLEESKCKAEIEVLTGDIRDFDSVSKAVKDCDVVFHLAALIGIPYSYACPIAYIETNIIGTYNILQASKECQADNIIITSTSETYGSAQYVPIDEIHPKAAQSPYAATKTSADQLALSYHKSFGLPVKIARPFNTFGPRQSGRAIIPTIITQLLDGKKEVKLGSLSPTRDLLFVKDTINGFIEIAKSDKTVGEEINIATGNEVPIGDLAKTIIDIINPQAKVVSDEQRIRGKNSEVNRLLGSNEKIKTLTKWQQKYDLDAGLEETIRWFKKDDNFKLYKSGIYNV
jgi:NAD dependent epimerase/dehydratase